MAKKHKQVLGNVIFVINSIFLLLSIMMLIGGHQQGDPLMGVIVFTIASILMLYVGVQLISNKFKKYLWYIVIPSIVFQIWSVIFVISILHALRDAL